MMKVITGNQFNTRYGKLIVPDDQESIYRIGERIRFENDEYTIQQVISPSVPDGKWTLMVA